MKTNFQALKLYGTKSIYSNFLKYYRRGLCAHQSWQTHTHITGEDYPCRDTIAVYLALRVETNSNFRDYIIENAWGRLEA